VVPPILDEKLLYCMFRVVTQSKFVMKVVVGAQLPDLFIANEFITIKAIHE